MKKIEQNKLLISSDFYSVQGEGKTTGTPSYFIRLANCNLTCGISARFLKRIQKERSLEDGEVFTGDLEMQGLASWTCDSISQWAIRGENREYSYLLDRWMEQQIFSKILRGDIHLIWTGGEPTMVKHQSNIVGFFNYISKSFNIANIFNEVETNGTVYIEDSFFELIDQINCSPKLQNSGMSKKRRIVDSAIKRVMEHKNYQFKFVINSEEDIKEIFTDFIKPFEIPLKNVVCMPGMDSREQFHERTRFVLEMAKKYGFIGLTRLHISAWDKTLNV